MITNKLTLGILAHVDAGKTTLSETILYLTGQLRKMGRVDHKNAFLDTYALEKDRGITIFSKQAEFSLKDKQITLLDTPGHVDFSSEMERTLQVLDYAVLLISGADGIQGHSVTLWKLLERFQIPVFIFVNKMDQPGTDRKLLLKQLQSGFHENCIDLSEDVLWEEQEESIAFCDEGLLEKYIESGKLERVDLAKPLNERKLFPVFFGSALKNTGVDALLKSMEILMKPKDYPEVFGARIFNITRDDQNNRLTYLKITGGSLSVKELLTNSQNTDQDIWHEKVDQIRIYSGKNYRMVQSADAGSICALTGLSHTSAGDGLGFEARAEKPVLEPVLSYNVLFSKEYNINEVLKCFRQMEEEEPHLNIRWNESLGEIHVEVMGEIEVEILKSIMLERYNLIVEFDAGNLVYKETIKDPVIGIGHFEPLRHYAEVHLLLEPGEPGSGMRYESECSEDILGKNWQRLVLSHLKEKKHIGVLTGSELTDMKIKLLAGQAHLKHTEGGDFREATFRAIRQGLMKAETVLLEPVYAFRLELPNAYLGKAISDIIRFHGRHEDPVIEEELCILRGFAPVAQMMNYGMEVAAYTKGMGKLSLSVEGYEPCHNQQEVVTRIAYEPDKDINNQSSSVFCAKGSGYYVSWDQVERHAHLQYNELRTKESSASQLNKNEHLSGTRVQGNTDDEVEEIFERTFRTSDKGKNSEARIVYGRKRSKDIQNQVWTKADYSQKQRNKFLLVDGYNIIFAWDELKTLADHEMDLARVKLIDILSNYKSQTEETVIVVFDAYRVEGGKGSTYEQGNIHVVFTKEAETADQYIERLVHTISPTYDVTVATSDKVEQVIIMGKGAKRLSAEGLWHVVVEVDSKIRDHEAMQEKKIKQFMDLDNEKKKR